MNNIPSLYWEALAELNKREAMREVLSVSEKPTDEKFDLPVVPGLVDEPVTDVRMELLTMILKMLMIKGFTLSEVVSVWNDVVEESA